MIKVDLGTYITESPKFYKNFISAHRDWFRGPVKKSLVNNLLKELGVNAVLRRKRLNPHIVMYSAIKRQDQVFKYGTWYLEFKNKQDYVEFKLKWE